jgi:pimeloyl-ACP methyl ester carboxylesterase
MINGLEDKVSGAHLVKRFREVVPNQTDIVELEGIGHFPHWEAPEIVLDNFFEFHHKNN